MDQGEVLQDPRYPQLGVHRHRNTRGWNETGNHPAAGVGHANTTACQDSRRRESTRIWLPYWGVVLPPIAIALTRSVLIVTSEGCLGDYMAVVIRPSAQYRIEQPYQVCLFSRLVGLDDFTDFVKVRFDVRFGRLHQTHSLTVRRAIRRRRFANGSNPVYSDPWPAIGSMTAMAECAHWTGYAVNKPFA